MSIDRFLQNRFLLWLLCGGGFAILALLDFLTPNLSLSLFYLIPIAILSWHGKRIDGLILAIFAGLARHYADQQSGRHYPNAFYEYWHLFVRYAFFTVTAWCFTKIGTLVREQRAMIREMCEIFNEGWELGSMLPVCTACGKARTDAEYLETVRRFIVEHPQAKFLHALCEECKNRAPKKPATIRQHLREIFKAPSGGG